jgi:hypothetical protein
MMYPKCSEGLNFFALKLSFWLIWQNIFEIRLQHYSCCLISNTESLLVTYLQILNLFDKEINYIIVMIKILYRYFICFLQR